MKNRLARMLILLVCGSLFPSCAAKVPPPPWISRISAIKAPIGPEEIFELPAGDPIPFAQLLNVLDTTRVIFIGESHDQIEHHQIQVRMIRELVAKGKDVVIGMEMFERAQQPTLDRWSQGLLTEEEFLTEVQWDLAWGMDYDLYKGILDAAKDRHLKVLGLNAPRDLVTKVAGHGIQGLSAENRKRLPEIDLNDRAHRAYIATFFKTHAKGSAKDSDNFYEAQCLWDEGMAQSLSEFLKSPQAAGKTVLVFAGSGHVVFGFGIPNRLYRRTSIPYQTIALRKWSENVDEDLTFTGASSPVANFLWITKPNPPEKKRPRIGVILKATEDRKGLAVQRVVPRSPAEKAGLLPEDRFIAVEGKEVSNVKDIHQALEEKGWRNNITFTILREGKEKEITVELLPSED